MGFKELIEFMSDKKRSLPKGEIHSGIPQSFKDEDKRQWKLFFKMIESESYEELIKELKK